MDKLEYIPGDIVSVYVGIKKYIVKIIGVEYENEVLSYQIKFPNGEIQYADKDNIVPIPLTPEILLKNGWMLYHLYYWFTEEKCLKLRLLKLDKRPWNAYIGSNLMRVNIHSVSDLQNLLFGLGLNSEMEV